MKRIGFDQMKNMSIDNLIELYRDGYRLEENTPIRSLSNFNRFNFSNIHPNIYSLQGPLLDPAVNFGKVTVSAGYDATVTSIVLNTNQGSKLPDPSVSGAFNLVWYNSTDYPDPSDDPNKEIVRCTTRTSDTLTVTRAQEGTSASIKNLSGKTYKMILSVTAKTISDISSAITARVAKSGDTMTGNLEISKSNSAIRLTEPGGYDFLITNNAGSLNITSDDPANTTVTILSNGRLGIGTTSPQNSLHVVGPTLLQGDQNAIRYVDAGANNRFLTGLRNDIVGNTIDYVFYSYGGNWIYSGGNIGIGTVSPTQKLDIVGNINLNGGYLLDAWIQRYNSLTFITDDTTGNVRGLRIMGDSGISPTTTEFRQWNFSTGVGTSGNIVLLRDGGNVGIGTTSPITKLHIEGGSTLISNTTEDQLILKNSGLLNPTLLWERQGEVNRSALLVNPTATTGGYYFRTGGSNGQSNTLMLVRNDGNVGIGTTSPSTKLHIEGGAGSPLDDAGYANYLIGRFKNIGAANQAYVEIRAQDAAQAGLLIKSSSHAGTSGWGIITNNSGNLRIGYDTDITNIKDGSAGLTLLTNGNAGIGTAGPNEILDIGGTKQTIKNFGNDRTFATSVFANLDKPAFATYIDAPIKTYYGIGQVIGGLGFLANDPVYGNIQFFTGNLSSTGGAVAERMRITNTGNVGVGTISPLVNLEVKGNIGISYEGNTSKNRYIGIMGNAAPYVGGSAPWAGMEMETAADLVAGSHDAWLHFITSDSGVIGGAKRVTIDKSGNVGIGTSTPQSKLHVFGNSASNLELLRIDNDNGAGGGTALSMYQGTTQVGQIRNYNDGTQWTLNLGPYNNLEAVAIKQNGNVGIGITNPLGTMHINRSSVGTYSVLSDASQGLDLKNWYIESIGGGAIAISAGNDALSDGRQIIRMTRSGYGPTAVNIVNGNFYVESGNVGIGTSTPFGKISNSSINIPDAAGNGGDSNNSLLWTMGTQGYTAIFQNTQSTASHSSGLLVKTAATDSGSWIAKFESGGNNRVTIMSNGLVGIGTTNPSRTTTGTTGSPALDVSRNIAKNVTEDNYQTIFFGSNDAANPLGISMGVHVSPTGVNRYCFIDGSEIGLSERPLILQAISNGRVGIGSGSIPPSGKLHVDGTVFFTGLGAASAGTTMVLVAGTNEVRPLLSSKEFKNSINDTFISPDISKLVVKQFRWNESNELDYGLITEEATLICPEIVNKDSSGKPLSIKWATLTSLLLKKVQLLEARISVLESKQIA